MPELSLPGWAAPDKASYLIHLTLFFNARHRVSFGPNAGPVHSHSWRIETQLRTFFRDPFGSPPVEFADLEERIRMVLRPFEGKLLNGLSPFDRIAPTTENLARFLFGRVGEVLAPTGVEIMQATVWEAPTKGVTVITPLPATVEQPLPGARPPAEDYSAALREASATRDGSPAKSAARARRGLPGDK